MGGIKGEVEKYLQNWFPGLLSRLLLLASVIVAFWEVCLKWVSELAYKRKKGFRAWLQRGDEKDFSFGDTLQLDEGKKTHVLEKENTLKLDKWKKTRWGGFRENFKSPPFFIFFLFFFGC